MDYKEIIKGVINIIENTEQSDIGFAKICTYIGENYPKLASNLQKAKMNEADQAMLDKACDAYCKVCGYYLHIVPPHVCRNDCDYYKNFKKAMEGE